MIREPVDKLVLATCNIIERNPPDRVSQVPGAQTLLLSHLRIAENTYRTIRFVCAEKPDIASRRPEYAVSIPPLTRSLADSLSTFVFLFQDLERNCDRYWKATWREAMEQHNRLKAAYGDDPSWATCLQNESSLLEQMRDEYAISDEQASNLNSLSYWPIPSKVLKEKNLSGERREFLQYMNDWFYRELSQATHLTGPGLLARAGFFLMDKDDDGRPESLNKYRSDNFVISLSLLLSLLSEVEGELQLGLAQRLLYVWSLTSQHFGFVQEFFQKRYSTLLASEPAA
jgi:hypothetical protein